MSEQGKKDRHDKGDDPRARVRGRAALGAGNNGGGGAHYVDEAPAGGASMNASADAAGPHLRGGDADDADDAQDSGGSGGAPRSASKWTRRIATALAFIYALAMFLLVLGILVPPAGVLSAIGTLLESAFSLHIFLASAVALLLALFARRLGGRGAAKLAILLAAFALIGALVPLVALVRAANRYGAVIVWGEHLRARAPWGAAKPDQTQLYATVEGKPLYADIYLAKGNDGASASSSAPAGATSSSASAGATNAAVLMIHGGGYSGGARSDGRDWDHWFAGLGYTVFDIDYRLDPPPTWKDAADDVACALGWIAAHANEYHVDPQRVLASGQSAGGGLALQVAYGLADGTFASSCGGAPVPPKAVFALYPPDDFALAWRMNTGIGPAGARSLNAAYIGGSPEQYPQRYRAVSAVEHVRPEFPPTLVAAGEHDHLVPFAGHTELATDFSLAGVPNTLVAIPYGEHVFDAAWGGLGSQITRRALQEFLAQHFPAR